MARQRLRPWLFSTLESGQVPGVEWVDRQQQIFRIPWKHGSKQDWTEEDSKIFLEWAIHTGKLRQGIDEPNYAQCKTRLRCALNKAPDIKERKDLESNDRPDPFKVYQFIDAHEHLKQYTPGDGMEWKDDEDMETEEQPGAPGVPTVVYDYSMKSETHMTGAFPSDLGHMDSGDLVRPQGGEEIAVKDLLASSIPTMDSIPIREVQGYPAVQQTIGHLQVTVPGDGNPEQHTVEIQEVTIEQVPSQAEQPSTNNTVVEEQYVPEVGNEVTAPINQIEVQSAQQVMVQCHYRSMYTLEYEVHNPEGFRIYYGKGPENTEGASVSLLESTFGPQNLEQIHLPEPTQFMTNQQQKTYTHQILDSFSRGIYFKFDSEGNLYACRLCKPSVFYKSNATDYTVQKLERNNHGLVKVFDFQEKFKAELAQLCSSPPNAKKPSAEVQLSIGQRPQNDEMSDNLLIRAKITHLYAKFLIEQVQGTEFPSIHFSGTEQGDHVAAFLGQLSISDPRSPSGQQNS